jgi:arginine/serine-rich splicing factor 7
VKIDHEALNRSPEPARGRKRSLTPDEDSPQERRPRNRSPEPAKGRKRSLTPDEGSPQERRPTSPKNGRLAAEQDGSNYSESPRRKSRSPFSPERESPVDRSYPSPEANGHGRSVSPNYNDDRSPIVDEDGDNARSPRGSPSP